MNKPGDFVSSSVSRRWNGRSARALVAAAVLFASAGWAVDANAFAPPKERQIVAPGDEQADESKRPELDPAAKALIDAEYLTPAERTALRIKHGVFEAADLTLPADRARAALVVGAWDDPSLSDPAADAEDRGEALVLRGELPEALKILDGLTTARARSLRLESLVMLGRPDAARAEAEAILELLRKGEVKDAPGLVWAARGLSLATGLYPPADAESRSADFKSLMSVLFSAREERDKLDPGVPLAEARLLWDKDNPAQAAEAMQSALTLNPKSAAAYALLGEMAVAQFDFDRGEILAKELRELRSSLGDSAGAVSPLAELVVARMRLRQRDPEGAMKAADRVLSIFPKQSEALALRASALGAMYDATGCDAQLAAFDVLFPGSALGLTRVGQALSEARQYELAEKYLTAATVREPGISQSWSELGLMLLQSGKDIPARDALRKANTLDPFNIRVDNSLKLISELLSYKTFESDHFIVRCRPGVDEVLAGEMLGTLEKIYARVTGNAPGGMDHEPPVKTLIELLPDHHWFSVRITGMPQLHTIAASTGPVIAMEAPRAGPGHKAGAYDWARVIQHEFTHTVSLSRAKNRMPHWFTEAAAVYLEDSPRDYNACQILARAMATDTLFDFDKINISFVRPEKPTDRSQAYAQGAWMYEYMIEAFGPRKPLELLDLYAKGQTEAQAFPTVLGVSREEFLTRFKAWGEEQLIAWGMRPKAGQPTIDELMSASGAAGGDEPQEPTKEMVSGWLEQYPDHPQALSLMVAIQLRDHQGSPTPEMVPLLQRAAAARPVDPLPRKLLADLSLSGKNGKAGDASAASIEYLGWLDAREQYTAVYAAELARAYAASGDWDKAEEKAERATRVAPYEPGPRELAASVAIKRKDYLAAERHIRALIALEPDRAVHQKRLEALLKMKP